MSPSRSYGRVVDFFKGMLNVWELVKSGGWMMVPIILSSIAAMAIVAERLWTLRASRVTPPHLLGQVWIWIKDKQLTADKLKALRADSPLGEILAAGLANSRHGREIMKECIEEAASRVVHELERYISALGTIAAMAPLLGLLGTVLGMIDIFSAFKGTQMTANAAVLAGGISKALVTTTFTRETQLRVELPEAASATAPTDQPVKQVEITISAEGVYSVNNNLLPRSDLATLSEAIEQASAGDHQLPLSISADGKTPHQAVVTAMDAAGKLGFSQLRMTTVEAVQGTP